MGGSISRLFDHEQEKSKQQNSSSLILENHDTQTPQPQKKRSLIDPRSASLGIPRTPIEIVETPPKETKKVLSAVPKHLKTKLYLETNFDDTPTTEALEQCLDPRSPNVDVPRTPILVETLNRSDTPKLSGSKNRSKTNLLSEMRQKMLGLDPRSPATNFDRTPILRPKSLVNEKKTRSQENLYTSSYDIKMPSRLSYCETSFSYDISEINVLPDIVSNLNDSQNPVNESSESNCSSSAGTNSDNSAVTVLRNGNEDSPDSSFGSPSPVSPLESPKVADSKILEEKLIADSDKIIDNVLLTAMKDFENKFNEAENKIKIWRDTLSPELEEDSEYDAGSESEGRAELVSRKQELIIEFDDDDCNIVGTIKRAEFNAKKTDSGEKKKKMNTKKELEAKKLFSPSVKQSVSTKKTGILNNRTPLRNRSNSNGKSYEAVLKSPHLRRKVPLSMRMHQENTPPNGKKMGLKSRINMTQWDGDSTVII